jgi:hypothetical protein
LKSKQDEFECNFKKECLDEIKVLEKQQYIDLYYGNQSGFCLTPVMAYCWQYAGEQVAILPQKGKRINVFGLMSKGKQLVTFSKEGALNAPYMVDCINQWVKSLTKPTVLVLDNAPSG